MAGEKILVVDDQEEIGELISHYLIEDGFKVRAITTPRHIDAVLRQEKPNLLILDVLLPDTDGIEVCRRLRQTTDIPILFISCKKDDIDKILALGVGGDDYITKPFSPRELVARVKAHLRRSAIAAREPADPSTPAALDYEGIHIDYATHTVIVRGKHVDLPAKEFDLLYFLASKPNRTFNNEQLFDSIWGMDSVGDPRTVMVHMSTLRKKIERDPSDPEFIVTIRGVGYKFNARP